MHPGVLGGVRLEVLGARIELLAHRLLRELLPSEVAELDRPHNVSVGRPLRGALAGASS